MTTLPQRLRQMADHTGLDAVAELLREAGDTLDRREAVIRILERDAPAEHYCDTHCTWLDHAAGCDKAEQPAEQERDGAMNAICKMFHHGEEVESDDGMAMLVPLDLWHDAIDALDSLIGDEETIPEAPQPAIPPGYKLVPESKLNNLTVWAASIRERLDRPEFFDEGRLPEGFPSGLIFEAGLRAIFIENLMLDINAAPEAPQPAKRVPLTDEEMRDALRSCPHDTVESLRVRWPHAKDFARAVIAAYEAKNGITGAPQ